MIQIKIGEHTFDVDREKLQHTSMLCMLTRYTKNDNIITLDDSANKVENIKYILDYFETEKLEYADLELLDYYGVFPIKYTYDEIYQKEVELKLRGNIGEYENLFMLDNFYDLKEFYEYDVEPTMLLFSNQHHNRNMTIYDLSMDDNIIIRKLFSCVCDEHDVKLYIAGGYVYNNIMNIIDSDSDIDVFFVGNGAHILEIVEEFSTLVKVRRFKRSHYTLTLSVVHRNINVDVQFILRIYNSFSEILHSFDVDSCCVGYDGEHLYGTERAFYALCNEFNTVNLDLLSPSYEYRLTKYAAKGMRVNVTNIGKMLSDRYIFTKSDMYEDISATYRKYVIGKSGRHSAEIILDRMHNMKFLKLLVFFEYIHNRDDISLLKYLYNLESDYDVTGVYDLYKDGTRSISEILDIIMNCECDGVNRDYYIDLYETYNGSLYITNKSFGASPSRDILCIYSTKFEDIVQISKPVYQMLRDLYSFSCPRTLKFIRSGSTISTLNRVVLANPDKWYNI